MRAVQAIVTLVASLASIAAVAALGAAPAYAADPAPLEPYPLDDIGRSVSPKGAMRCPEVPLETHAGAAVKWKTPLRVHPAFAARLSAFEQVIVDVATQIYGRAPTRITHLGSFNCRRIARYPDLLSEHGLGNAVDVAGFEFAALGKADAKKSGLPRALTKSFKLTILGDWDNGAADDTAKGYHRRFLHALIAALEARPDIFRVMLGPAYPGHKNHFHFDCAPYRLVII